MTNNNIAHTDTGDVLSPDNTWMNSTTSTVTWDGATAFYLIAPSNLNFLEIASFLSSAPSARAHYQRAIMDVHGNLAAGSTVRLIDPVDGYASLSPDTIIWAADSPSTDTLTNPFVTENGVIDFYLTHEQRVAIGVTPPGDVEHIMKAQDVLVPGGGGT